MPQPSLTVSLILFPLIGGLSGCGEEPDNSRWEAVQDAPADGGTGVPKNDPFDEERPDDPDVGPDLWRRPGQETGPGR